MEKERKLLFISFFARIYVNNLGTKKKKRDKEEKKTRNDDETTSRTR
jgi:hypothetical protein